jgi:hypothetical protein
MPQPVSMLCRCTQQPRWPGMRTSGATLQAGCCRVTGAGKTTTQRKCPTESVQEQRSRATA